jgi:hypothetical protein
MPAAALLIRTDRDDAEYLELASRYPACVRLSEDGGEGVLINSRWVLTAAHRAQELREKKAGKLRIGASEHRISAYYIHPKFAPGQPNDIALILLSTPVTDVLPTPIYTGTGELRSAVAIVGHGGGKARAGINTVDTASKLTLGVRVKSGDERSDLQGATTPDETGAPAFIETPHGIFVAGILSTFQPGNWEIYSRASGFGDWIQETMLEVARAEAEALMK